MTSHDRNSISFDSSPASTVDYSVAYSSDLVATINYYKTTLSLKSTTVAVLPCGDEH